MAPPVCPPVCYSKMLTVLEIVTRGPSATMEHLPLLNSLILQPRRLCVAMCHTAPQPPSVRDYALEGGGNPPPASADLRWPAADLRWTSAGFPPTFVGHVRGPPPASATDLCGPLPASRRPVPASVGLRLSLPYSSAGLRGPLPVHMPPLASARLRPAPRQPLGTAGRCSPVP